MMIIVRWKLLKKRPMPKTFGLVLWKSPIRNYLLMNSKLLMELLTYQSIQKQVLFPHHIVQRVVKCILLKEQSLKLIVRNTFLIISFMNMKITVRKKEFFNGFLNFLCENTRSYFFNANELKN